MSMAEIWKRLGLSLSGVVNRSGVVRNRSRGRAISLKLGKTAKVKGAILHFPPIMLLLAVMPHRACQVIKASRYKLDNIYKYFCKPIPFQA